MKCPDCGNEYVCPCGSCRPRYADKTPWIRVGDYEEACGLCGVVRPLDEWLDIEMKEQRSSREL